MRKVSIFSIGIVINELRLHKCLLYDIVFFLIAILSVVSLLHNLGLDLAVISTDKKDFKK